MYALVEIGLFVLGHFLMAILFYLNHRFSFHPVKKIKSKAIRLWKRIHTKHHTKEIRQGYAKDLIPTLGWILFGLVCAPFAWISIGLAIGLFSYVPLYEYIHSVAHRRHGDRLPKYVRCHLAHHYIDAKSNFATFWMWIDKMFGTYRKFSNQEVLTAMHKVGGQR